MKREATHMVEKLWSCFPSFCVSPYIGNALEIMAQPLCKALETNLIAREHIINGLSNKSFFNKQLHKDTLKFNVAGVKKLLCALN